jgi:phage gp29-like protein
MCLVIDACCFALVFESKTKNHAKFIAVLKWIEEGNGRMIYGGTKYNAELGRATKVLGLLRNFLRKDERFDLKTRPWTQSRQP